MKEWGFCEKKIKVRVLKDCCGEKLFRDAHGKMQTRGVCFFRFMLFFGLIRKNAAEKIQSLVFSKGSHENVAGVLSVSRRGFARIASSARAGGWVSDGGYPITSNEKKSAPTRW